MLFFKTDTKRKCTKKSNPVYLSDMANI